MNDQQSVFDFVVKDAKGEDFPLAQFRGKILLIVNVASACGYTPQYTGLQAIYDRLKDRGVVVVAFPCNQFGFQERGTDDDIQAFCSDVFSVTFPVLAKVRVNGDLADPLYKHVKAKAPGLLNTEAIKWNFTKFLVGRDGRVLKRFGSAVKPEQILLDLDDLLNRST